jgi:hypothetical protein
MKNLNSSQTEQLANYIKLWGYATCEQVDKEAYNINPQWQQKTYTRSLRRRRDIKAVPKDDSRKPSGDNPIVGYESVIKHEPLRCKQFNNQLAFI